MNKLNNLGCIPTPSVRDAESYSVSMLRDLDMQITVARDISARLEDIAYRIIGSTPDNGVEPSKMPESNSSFVDEFSSRIKHLEAAQLRSLSILSSLERF